MCNIMKEIDDLEWKKKDTVQKRRQLDAKITKKFLSQEQNKENIERIVDAFSREVMNKKDDGSNLIEKFYLKGGSAINVLQGMPPDPNNEDNASDYDFQLVPTQKVYDDWMKRARRQNPGQEEDSFSQLDAFILNALIHAAGQWPQNEDDRYIDFWREEPHCEEVYEGYKNLRKIGFPYKDKTYSQIKTDPAFDKVEGRIKLTPDKISADNRLAKTNALHGLHIYVNYTIPGFLLYRLVKAYRCKIKGEEEECMIKSEIIDVSVPRLGSAERYISQEGVITHFREIGDFMVPGWGYHFYENINLLQEVFLGYSGSPHKVKKRWERLNLSIEKLKEVNGGVIDNMLGKTMKEPCGAENRDILAYPGVLLYPLTLLLELDSNFINESPVIPELLNEYKLRMKTLSIQNSKGFAEACVGFAARRISDARIPQMTKILEEVKGILRDAGDEYAPLPAVLKTTNKHFYGKYIFINVKRKTFNQIKTKVEGWHINDDSLEVRVNGANNILYYPLHNTGGSIVYAFFYTADGQEVITPEEILEKSILFAQRMMWQQYLENKK